MSSSFLFLSPVSCSNISHKMPRKDPETVVSCEGMVQNGAKEQKAVLLEKCCLDHPLTCTREKKKKR